MMKEIDEVWPQMNKIATYLWQADVWREFMVAQQAARDKIKEATTLSEFRFYRDLFEKCLDLANEGVSSSERTIQQMLIINQQLTEGPPQ